MVRVYGSITCTPASTERGTEEGHTAGHRRLKPRVATRCSHSNSPFHASLNWPIFGSEAKGCYLLLSENYPPLGLGMCSSLPQKHLSFRVQLKYHLLHEALRGAPPTMQNLPFLCSRILNQIPAPLSLQGPQRPALQVPHGSSCITGAQ